MNTIVQTQKFGFEVVLYRLGNMVALLQSWIDRSNQRRQLQQLSPQLRQDLGLSEEAIRHEAEKPFWR